METDRHILIHHISKLLISFSQIGRLKAFKTFMKNALSAKKESTILNLNRFNAARTYIIKSVRNNCNEFKSKSTDAPVFGSNKTNQHGSRVYEYQSRNDKRTSESVRKSSTVDGDRHPSQTIRLCKNYSQLHEGNAIKW